MTWDPLISYLLTQGVLGVVALVEALVIRQLYSDLKAAQNEIARVLEESADSLEHARDGRVNGRD